MVSKVSLIKGKDRMENLKESLRRVLSKEELDREISDKKIIIKPNLVSDSNELAATSPESVKTVIEFLNEFGFYNIAIAEISAHSTSSIYRNLGYDRLGVELIDLSNEDQFEEITLDYEPKPITIKVSKMLLSEDTYIISLAKPKTHDCVVATLSIKNLLMGAIKNKMDMHGGIKAINSYLSLLSERLWPDLAVIDGFRGMEGNGPTRGEKVKSEFAITSLDPLAADWISLKCMGIDPLDVGYLYYLSRKGLGNYSEESIEIEGYSIEECEKKYKLHDTIDKQLGWKE